MRKVNFLGPAIIVIIALSTLVWPVVTPGFWRSDDGGLMVTRLAAFHQTLRTGQFPVRLLENLNHGYGYPVTNFLYPLPFYLGEAIHLLRFNFLDSVKVLFLLGVLGSAVAMLLFASDEFGPKAGLVSALLYSYLPYRIFDLFRRGSLGEELALVFPPLIFLFLGKALKRSSVVFAALAGTMWAALVVTHNVAAFIFSPLILGFILVKTLESIDRPRIISLSIFACLSAAILSAFFWIPAVWDLPFTRALSVQVAESGHYFIFPDNFLSTTGLILPLILLAAGLVIWKSGQTETSLLLFFSVVSLFLASPFSADLWHGGLLPRLVQFPWRFLAVSVFGGAVLGGWLLKSSGWGKIGIFLVLVVYCGWLTIRVDKIFYPEGYYTTSDSTTTVKDEYLPRWVKEPLKLTRTGFMFLSSGNGSVVGRSIYARSFVTAKISRVYFPGWQVLVNEQKVNIYPDDNGLITFNLPAGNYLITARFTETPVRLTADLISLGGLLILILLVGAERLKILRL